MLQELSPPQRALAEFMSEVSELAHNAGWMTGLEIDLWHAVCCGPFRYGRLELTHTHIEELQRRSAECGGWVYFDASNGETFVPMEQWLVDFASA